MLDRTPGKFFNHEYVINEKLCELWIYYVFMLVQEFFLQVHNVWNPITEIANNNGEGDNFVEF